MLNKNFNMTNRLTSFPTDRNERRKMTRAWDRALRNLTKSTDPHAMKEAGEKSYSESIIRETNLIHAIQDGKVKSEKLLAEGAAIQRRRKAKAEKKKKKED